ncbi:DEG15 [Scenedesmus sp. PABB004]|nr:DEG15 [Scenedesmus sp. PABB004]
MAADAQRQPAAAQVEARARPPPTHACPPPTPALAVQVEVRGPDAKRARAGGVPFHAADGPGRTALSASGLALLPPPGRDAGAGAPIAVLAPLSCLHPFLLPDARRRPAEADGTRLAPGTRLEVLAREPGGGGRLLRAPARLARVAALPAALSGAEALLRDANAAGAAGAWKLGWALAEGQPAEAATPTQLAHVAVLELEPGVAGAEALLQAMRRAAAAAERAPRQAAACGCCALGPGLPLVAHGSPFGCLAAHQFQGALVTGVVSTVVAPLGTGGGGGALFVVDARALPGMEGGPITCRCCGRLLGLLAVPLANTASRVELPLGVAAGALAPALAAAGVPPGGALTLLALAAPDHPAPCGGQPPGGGGIAAQAAAAVGAQPALRHSPACGAAAQELAGSSACAGTAAPCASAGALQAAARGVVMVRVGASWGSGVVMCGAGGLVLTNAHLFKPSAAAGGQQARRPQTASVRLAAPQGSRSAGAGGGWLPAALLTAFGGHADLAVLQLQPAVPGAPLPALAPLALEPGPLLPGEDVAVLGHGLMGPGAGWPPAVTAGCAARVVALPAPGGSGGGQASRASMVITTAGVHAGASGGALVNASGRLVGLVTSNSRHVSGATLPHFAFCAAADELRPLWAWAARHGAGAGAAGALRELRALDVRDAAGNALWGLLPPPREEGASSSGGGGGALARMDERLAALLPRSRL